MDQVIELSTRLRDVSDKRKNNAFQATALYVLFILAMPIVIFMPRYGMPWEWPWAEIWRRLADLPHRIWERGDPEAYLVFLLLPSHYLATLSMQQRLRITPQSFEWSSRLPTWAAFLQPAWQLQRSQIVSVRVDLSRVSQLPRAARVRFETKLGPKAIPLFGWYRLGRSVESQQPISRRSFLTGRWQGDVESLPIVQALRDAGIEYVVDSTPVTDPLRKSPAGWMVAVGSIAAMAYAMYAIINQKYAYAGWTQWLLVDAVAALAAWVTWRVVRDSGMMREEKIGGVVAAAAMFGLAAWAGAPALNAATSDGPHDKVYRYAGEGQFVPREPGPPDLNLSKYRLLIKDWQPGDEISVPLVHGALGWWQYDRDETVSRLAVRRTGGRK